MAIGKFLFTIFALGLLAPLTACHTKAPVGDPAVVGKLQGLSVKLDARETGKEGGMVPGVIRLVGAGLPTTDTLVTVHLTASDPWGAVLTEGSAVSNRPFQLRLPRWTSGSVQIRAELAREGEQPLKAEGWIYSGDYSAAVTQLETTAKSLSTLLKGQKNETPVGAERLRLERRLAIPEHALAWLGRAHAKPTDNQLVELAYLQRDLDTVAAGKDPTEATPGGSHLMAIDLGAAAPTSATRIVRFWVHLPADYGQRHDWPLAVFLHGSTESKDMVETFRSPLPAYPGGVGMPCVYIAAKAEGRGWNIDALNLMLDYVLAQFAVDPDHVALLGHSMGGMGTINWMTKSPERFSAYAPMSGVGDPSQAGAYSYVPAWFIHGRKDPAVNVGSAPHLMHWVGAFGGSPRTTLQPEGDHMTVFSMFAQRDFWTWLAQQKRQPAPAHRPEIAFDKQGLGPLSIEETPAGTFYAAVAPRPYLALPLRDRIWQDVVLREKLDTAMPGVDGPLCLRIPNAAAADATSATRHGYFMPGKTPAAADGFDAQAVPAQRCIVRIYYGAPEGLPAALEATRASARQAGLELTGEEWQVLWWANRDVRAPRGGRERALMRELRLVAKPVGE